MSDLTHKSVENGRSTKGLLCELKKNLPDESLHVLTLTNVRDRLILDSTDSASPVKRLITMYNATGLAAQKASRRKAKVIAQKLNRMSEIPISCITLTGTDEAALRVIGIVKEPCNNPDSPVDSDGNTPQQCESEDEVDWSSDELSVEKLSADQSPQKLSPLKPGPVDIFQEEGAEMNEVFWEIANFNLDEAIYESAIFDYAKENWNFSFGHNNAGGYGYILCLHHPQIDPLHLQCTFKMHNSSCPPYSKTRAEAYVFGINSMNSRGFVNFASTEAVRRKILTNGNLRLSVSMKVVPGIPQSKSSSPQKNSVGEVFDGCSRQSAETKSSSNKFNRYSTKLHSTDFMKEISQSRSSRSLLREADCQNDVHNKMKSLKTVNDDTTDFDEHDGVSSTNCFSRDRGHSDGPQSFSPTKKVVCPISFQPFIAFKGLYCTSSDDYDSHTTIDGPPRSPTGLIAPPYIPITDDTASSNVVDTTDSSKSECGFCGFPGDTAEIENSASLPMKTKKEGGIIKDMDGHEILKVKGARGSNLYWKQGDDVLENEQSTIADDNSTGGNETPIHLSSDDDEGTTSEDNRSPQLECASIDKGSPIISVKDSKCTRSFPSVISDSQTKIDQLGNLFLPCIRGKSHDLLADSLKTIAQHTCDDEIDPTLLMATNGSHLISKHFSLTLPFRESSYLGNKLNDSMEVATTVENFDDGSCNNIDKNLNFSNAYNLKNYPSPCINNHSTLNGDAEISPMSPPSYTSLNDHYFSANTTADDSMIALPTIYEVIYRANKAEDNRGPGNLAPSPDYIESLTTMHQNISIEDGYQSKRSRIGENQLSLTTNKKDKIMNGFSNSNITKLEHGEVLESIFDSKRLTFIGDPSSESLHGGCEKRNCHDKLKVKNDPNTAKISKYSIKVMKRTVPKVKKFCSPKKSSSLKSDHTILSIIIAATGVLLSQSNVNLLSPLVAKFAYLIIITALRGAAVMIMVGLIIALDQAKQARKAFLINSSIGQF